MGTSSGNLRATFSQLRQRLSGFAQIAGILILVGGAVIYAQAPSESEVLEQSGMPVQQNRQQPVPLVTVVRPQKSVNTVQISATGSIVVRNTVELVPQVSGRVVWVAQNFKRGGSFKAGETVIRIDPEDFELALEQALAEKEVALSRLELAQAESDAAIANYALLRPGAEVPPLVAKLPQVEQARAQIAAAEANEHVAQLNLRRTAFSLPFGGRVVSSSAEVGQMLNQGQSFGEVFADDSIEALVPVSAAQLERLSPVVGRAATVQAGEREYTARVDRIAPVVDERTRFAQLYLSIDNSTQLFPGTFLNVELFGPSLPDTFLLPEAAEQINQTVWAVYENKLTRIEPQFLNRNVQGIVTAAFDSGAGVVLGTVPGGHEGMPVQVEPVQ